MAIWFCIANHSFDRFNDIVDSAFTAHMEDLLDKIEDDGLDWHKIIGDFYTPFKAKLINAKGGAHFESADEPSDIPCEKCGTLMNSKRGRFGKYLSCPSCKTNKSLKVQEEKQTDIVCDKCGSMMVERTGKFGKYLACPNYPSCKNIKPIVEKVGKCPKCNKDLIKRFTKTGKIFYGCTAYPDCDFVSWDIPTGEKCPVCGDFIVKKRIKNKDIIKCNNKNCTYQINGTEENE